MFAIMLFSVIVTLLIIAVNPKLGSFLIWLILFTYPHGWWYYRQFLPLNIGVDDLFCIFLFIIVLLRRNLLGGIQFRFNYAFWTISSFTLIAAVAIIAGSKAAEPYERILYIKDIMKLGVYWGLFYAIVHCIDDEKDLTIQFTMFSISAVIGAIIIIGQYFWPYRMAIFLPPAAVEKAGLEYATRTSGAFMNPNSAACMLAGSLALVTTTIRLQRGFLLKVIVYSFVLVLLTALLMTRSRSGLLALAGTFGLMGVFGKDKKVAWFLIIAGLFVTISFPQIRDVFKSRIERLYDPTTGIYGSNVAGRFQTWQSYFETATTKDYLLGQGFRQGIVKNGMESHSAYVSLLTVYGIGGLVWALVALFLFLRKVLFLRKEIDPLIRIVASGCMWSLTAWGIYGLAADAISSQYSRYLLFYLIVLIDRAYIITRDKQELIFYEDQETLEQSSMYAGVSEEY